MKKLFLRLILFSSFSCAFASEKPLQLPEDIKVYRTKQPKFHNKREYAYHFSVGPVTVSAFPRGEISMQHPHIALGSVGVPLHKRVSFETEAVKAISNSKYTTFAETPSSPEYMASVYKALELRFAGQSKSLDHWLKLEKYHEENPDAEINC